MIRRLRFSASLLAMFAAALSLFSFTASAAQVRGDILIRPPDVSPIQPMLLIDGKAVNIQHAELIRGVEVMVWIRDLQTLGWGTLTQASRGQIVFQSKRATLTFEKDQDTALVNSLPVSLPIRTYSRNGKFMVPLSFVAKALGYNYAFALKPVAIVSTVAGSQQILPKASNTVAGKVVYNGAGVEGIKVRLVDKKYNVVKGAEAVTDAEGNYQIQAVPNGTYMAYIYVKDNPRYFNRKSEELTLTGGSTVLLRDISLGKILSPLEPGAHATPKNGKIAFAWTKCTGAVTYELLIKRPDAKTPVAQIITRKPEVWLAASRFLPGVRYRAEVSAFNSVHDFLGGTPDTGGRPWTFSR